MVCKKCSNPIPDDGVFCPVCGARADGHKACPKCDKLVAEDSVFCPYCGERIDGNKLCPTCQTAVPENAVFCSNCGTRLDEKSVCSKCGEAFVGKFCPFCGTEKNAPASVKKTSAVAEETSAKEEPKTVTAPNAKAETPKQAIQAEESVTTNAEEPIVEENASAQTVEGPTGELPISYFALPKQVDEKEFYAEVLTEIALDRNTPDDIFISGTFSPVKTEYRQYLLALGDADMSYSATVGYDRKVTYTEYSNGKAVQKTKTVTDWKPFSGTRKGTYTGCVKNDATKDPNCITISTASMYELFDAKHAVSMDKVSFKTTEPKTPTEATIHSAQLSVEASAHYACKSSLPGDRHRDFHCDGTTLLKRLSSHVAPLYVLDYKYQGTSYSYCGHSSKTKHYEGKMPSAKKEIASEIENTPLVTTFNFLTFGLLLASIIISFVAPIWLIILAGVLAITSFVVLCVVRKRTTDTIYQQKALLKKQTLIKHLKQKGIKPPAKLQS